MSAPVGNASSVDLYWLPLGAGGPRIVRRSGHLYEAVAAWHGRRAVFDLYHSALLVRLRGESYAIEMAPVWSATVSDRGAVAGGPVGSRLLGHSRLFRYEVRRWRGGRIPDLAEAVGGPQRLSCDEVLAGRLLEALPDFPGAVWGRDELTGGPVSR
jgi:hypothetical protein